MKNEKYGTRFLWMIVAFLAGGVGIKLMKIGLSPYLDVVFALIGVSGLGLFGHHFGVIVKMIASKKDPETARKYKIEQNDERNISISTMAKSKAFDSMSAILAPLMVACALLNTDYIVLVLIIVVYLLLHGVMVYHFLRLQKTM